MRIWFNKLLFGIVRSLKGELIVLSNNAALYHGVNGSVTTYAPNISLKGTLLVIELDKRYLPDIEDRVEDEEFIF